MKTKIFTVTGTGAWAWAGPVSVIFYESGADAGGQTARIRVRSPDGNVLDVEMKPGRQVTLAVPVDGIVIESMTGNAITGKISLGNGDIKDASLLGTVEVVDGGKARSLAGSTFSGLGYASLAAGQYAESQLWNPVGSGKNVIVAQVVVTNAVAATLVWLRRTTAQFPSLCPTPNGVCKKFGTAASTAELRARLNAAATAGAGDLGAVAMTQRTATTFRWTEPLILVPGSGLACVPEVQSLDMAASFEFAEEAQ